MGDGMEPSVREITAVTDELCHCVNHLIGQLSSSAAPLSREDLEAIVAAPGITLLVAYAGQAPVGMLTLVIFATPTGRRALIEDVVVDAERRGHGIGRALTIEAVRRARGARTRKIDLTSSPERVEANALYQRLGFQRRETNVYRLLP